MLILHHAGAKVPTNIRRFNASDMLLPMEGVASANRHTVVTSDLLNSARRGRHIAAAGMELSRDGAQRGHNRGG